MWRWVNLQVSIVWMLPVNFFLKSYEVPIPSIQFTNLLLALRKLAKLRLTDCCNGFCEWHNLFGLVHRSVRTDLVHFWLTSGYGWEGACPDTSYLEMTYLESCASACLTTIMAHGQKQWRSLHVFLDFLATAVRGLRLNEKGHTTWKLSKNILCYASLVMHHSLEGKTMFVWLRSRSLAVQRGKISQSAAMGIGSAGGLFVWSVWWTLSHAACSHLEETYQLMRPVERAARFHCGMF